MKWEKVSRKAAKQYLKKLRVFLIAGTGFLAFLGVTLFAFSGVVNSYFPNQTNFQILQISISASGVFVTLLFYLGLLWLYFQIKNIQEMERRPLVEPADYSFEGDVVDVWLSNYGRGSATEMELELEIMEPENLPVEVNSEPVPLYREGERGVQGETAIPPEEELVKFRTTPGLNVENEEGEIETYLNWGAAVTSLHLAGVDEVDFHLRVNYSNQLGENDSVTLTEKPRGLEVEAMSRLDEAVHGVPPTKGGGATKVEAKLIVPIEDLINNDRLSEGSEKILKKISRNDEPLAISEIGVFRDYKLEELVCENLVYKELLEKVEGKENVLTETGPVDIPTEYKLTKKGEEYLNKISS